MPSICGLDPDDWQETCDTGMGYFWQWGWGLHDEPSTMPLWDRQLERPAPLPWLAAGWRCCARSEPGKRGPPGGKRAVAVPEDPELCCSRASADPKWKTSSTASS